MGDCDERRRGTGEDGEDAVDNVLKRVSILADQGERGGKFVVLLREG